MIPLLMMTMGANVALSAEPTSVWVDFSHPRAAETVQRLGMGWSEGWNGDWIHMDGDPDMVQSLKEQGIPLYPAIKAVLPPSDVAGYHTPDEMLEKMEELHTAYPDLTQRVDL